jgi:hypothetical protein
MWRLQITWGGGVLLLRALEGAIEQTGGRAELHADLVAREVRISLGQLPEAVRAGAQDVRLFGPTPLAEQLAGELQRRISGAEWKVEVVTRGGSMGVRSVCLRTCPFLRRRIWPSWR